MYSSLYLDASAMSLRHEIDEHRNLMSSVSETAFVCNRPADTIAHSEDYCNVCADLRIMLAEIYR